MEIVVRALIMYSFVWLLMRIIGRKELSSLSAFELVLLMAMGDLIQQGVTQEDQSLTGSMLAIGTFALLVVGLSYVSFRWPRSRAAIEGVPVVVVKEGKPLARVLTIERLTLEDLEDAAREQGIDDLRTVRMGVLESDGKFSFLTADGPSQSANDDQAVT
jgi:uncharacterized membrane protein YcaP (DUF421 family)